MVINIQCLLYGICLAQGTCVSLPAHLQDPYVTLYIFSFPDMNKPFSKSYIYYPFARTDDYLGGHLAPDFMEDPLIIT